MKRVEKCSPLSTIESFIQPFCLYHTNHEFWLLTLADVLQIRSALLVLAPVAQIQKTIGYNVDNIEEQELFQWRIDGLAQLANLMAATVTVQIKWSHELGRLSSSSMLLVDDRT